MKQKFFIFAQEPEDMSIFIDGLEASDYEVTLFDSNNEEILLGQIEKIMKSFNIIYVSIETQTEYTNDLLDYLIVGKENGLVVLIGSSDAHIIDLCAQKGLIKKI